MSDKGLKNALRITLNVLVNSVIILLLMQAFTFSFNFGYKVFADSCANANDTNKVSIQIPKESSSKEIVDILDEAGVIDDKNVMLIKMKISKYHGKLMPGTYMVSPSMTYEEILKTLSNVQETKS